MAKSALEYAFPAGLLVTALASLVAGFNQIAGLAVLLGIVAGIVEGVGRETTKTVWMNIGILLVGSALAGAGSAMFVGSLIGPILQAIGTYVALVGAVSLITMKINSKL